jgi:hypothetical protein
MEDDEFFDDEGEDCDCGECGPRTDDPEFPRGTIVKVDGHGGVAWHVLDVNGDMVRCQMVGDNRPSEFDRTDLTIINREDFCGECGATGCTHDGLDRD